MNIVHRIGFKGHVAFRFHSPAGHEIGGFGMHVLALTPDQHVHWQVKEGPAEWLGTEGEFMTNCRTEWATFLLNLRELLETGQGRPAPHDLQISNWH